MLAGTSLNLGKPKNGGCVSTRVSHHPGTWLLQGAGGFRGQDITIPPDAQELLPVLPCLGPRVTTLPPAPF